MIVCALDINKLFRAFSPIHKQLLPGSLGSFLRRINSDCPSVSAACSSGLRRAAALGIPVRWLTWAIEIRLRFSDKISMAANLLSAMPMLGIYPILAQVYGKENFTATALLVTTIASFFSLSDLLWLSKHLV
ncbi:hypothetical protein ACO0LB_07805 [Undibacterium sp. SXout7W]|uniref:hypothetical protein n=1 Tax=Undibacterium sp. SXout7W TaxID=3413049 RepID=UPI003BF35288